MGKVDWLRHSKALDEITQAVGLTPMVRLRRIPKEEGISADIYVKLEYFSPTGSLKDRIYLEMFRQAIERGELRPGMEVIEASTGNAGIACAWVGSLLGYPVTIVMPEGMSEERKMLMRAYGAKLVFVPGAESDVDLALEKVRELKEKNPGKYWEPGQFSNPANPEAHYTTTGPEIWEQMDGKVDAFLAAAGTAGTITGVGRYLKERDPQVRIYVVEPTEAPVLAQGEWGTHRIEGIGDGFVPDNLDLGVVDGVILVSSDEAIEMARRMAREEGILCGVSSGANVAAAIKLARRRPDLRRIATMVNDDGRRYFSTPLFGVEKKLRIPERAHEVVRDPQRARELADARRRWEIVR
ncbi:MAG: cysteine synthase A [Candidatus Korarchaeota archaeon]|nr:cysteine synthase A [Candidatus Korarchaeota archaeon]